MGRSILSQTYPDPLDDEICIKFYLNKSSKN